MPLPVHTLAVDGRLVFALDQGGGLAIYDYSDPDAPVFRGAATLPATPRAAVVAGGRLWVAAGDSGLVVCTLTGTGIGQIVVVPLPVTAVDVAVAGSAVAVAGGAGGLAMLDATDPGAPVVVDVLDVYADVDAVAVLGDRVYVATSLGVPVIDATDPSAPEQLYYLGTNSCTDVATAPNRLYTIGDGLVVLDLTDPDAPRYCRHLDLAATHPTGLAVGDDRVYVSTAALGILAVDVADPDQPYLGAVGFQPCNGSAVAVVAGRPLLADTAGRLVTLRDAAAGPMPVIGRSHDGAGSAVDCAGPIAAVSCGDYQRCVAIMDLSDPATPAVRLFCNMADPPNRVLLCGETLWATPDPISGKVRAWDLSEPNRAIDIDLPDRTIWWESMARWNGSVVAREYTHLYVYDVSAPSAPELTGSSMPIPTGTGAFAVVGDLAVTALADAGLVVFRLHPASDPEFLAYLDDGLHVVALVGDDGRIFAATDGTRPGVREISLADPAAPTETTFLPVPDVACRALQLVDGVLYAAITDGGVQAFDVATPGTITPIGTWGGWAPVLDLAPCSTSAGTFLVAVSEAGLEVLPLAGATPAAIDSPTAQALGLLDAMPNPFNPVVTLRCSVPRGGPVDVVIYDLRGRRMAVLADGEAMPAGDATWTWPGTDTAGRAVPSGVYFAEVRGPGLHAVRKLALVR